MKLFLGDLNVDIETKKSFQTPLSNESREWVGSGNETRMDPGFVKVGSKQIQSHASPM